MELLVQMELPGLACHLGAVFQRCVKCWQRAVPLVQTKNWFSWGIMWVEKEAFYEQNQHRGREEEVFRCRHGGGLCSLGGSLLWSASSWAFQGLGFRVCFYSPVSSIGGG